MSIEEIRLDEEGEDKPAEEPSGGGEGGDSGDQSSGGGD